MQRYFIEAEDGSDDDASPDNLVDNEGDAVEKRLTSSCLDSSYSFISPNLIFESNFTVLNLELCSSEVITLIAFYHT